MNIKRDNRFIGFILLVFFVLVSANNISAKIEYGENQSSIQDNPNVVIRGTSNADEAKAADMLATIKYDDNVTSWYVVYPTASDALADGLNHGDKTDVTYNGVTYNNVSVFVGNLFNGATGIDSIMKDNTTIFFKPGNYTTAAGQGNYARLYKENLSLIGLENDVNNPSVKFDLGYKTMLVYGIFSRNQNTRQLIHNDFYAANIIFDAGNREMKSNEGNSSGQYYIHMNSAKNVVFDNVTIQRVANNVYGSANVALNIIHADNVLFNNVTFKDSTAATGYAPLQVNNGASNIYFNNLSLNNVTGNHNSSFKPFIKIENGSTYPADLPNTSVFFTNGVNFSNMTDNLKSIYIESYLYDTVAFPSDIYRYAQLRNQNGSWTTGFIVLSNTLPSSANSYAIFDLKDNTFVVKKYVTGDSTNSIVEKDQVQNIINTTSFIRSIKGITDKETYNIKYEVGSELEEINLPKIAASGSYATSYAGYYEKINLDIIPVSDKDNTINTREVFDFDPDVSKINLPVENETDSRYQIYNIDFDKLAKYSLHETIFGIDGTLTETDPYKSLYGTTNNLNYSEYLETTPDGKAYVLYSNIDTFQSSYFTSLVQKIAIDDNGDVDVIYIGDTIQLVAVLGSGNDNSYNYNVIDSENVNKNTSNDDVPEVMWFSSDTSVATVDQTGKVTILKDGSATIIAKAKDIYNDGEIEKPWATYNIEAKKLAKLDVRYIDGDNNKVLDQYGEEDKVGSEYTTSKKDFKGYTFVKVIGEPNGYYTEEDTVVTYVYKKIETSDDGKEVDLPKTGSDLLLVGFLTILGAISILSCLRFRNK